MSETDDKNRARLRAGFHLPPEKIIYFNGFVVAMGSSDVAIVLEHSNEPVAALTTSLITAKTLLNTLSEAIQNYEEKTGRPIMTMKEVEDALSKDPS